MDDRTTHVSGTDASRTSTSSGAPDVSATADDDARAREIQQEIAQTREDIAETINANQDRLSPAHIATQAKEQLKVATTERMHAMADTAGEAAGYVADRTREGAQSFMGSLKSNPYPAILIGIGVAWWVRSSRQSDNDYYDWQDRDSRWRGDSSQYGQQRYGSPGYGSSAYGSSGSGSSGYGRSDYGSESDSSMAEGVTSTVKEYASDATSKAKELASDAREYLGDTGQAMRRKRRQAQTQLQRMLNENPLVVGAGMLMLGAAFGMSLPETERENEWLGEARDSVMDRAQHLADNAAQELKSKAMSAVGLGESSTNAPKP